MTRLSQDVIDRLLRVRKSILDNIEWAFSSRRKRKMRFEVNVLSGDEDMFKFTGYYALSTRKLSLTLRYGNIPLVTMHFGTHNNPIGTNPPRVERWHKHNFSELYDRDYAFDVSNEFNLNLRLEEFIERFKEENNMEFEPNRGYIRRMVLDYGIRP